MSERRRGIDRAIMLLEALLRHRAPMKVSDIARMLGAPRSTVYEIVNRLLKADMLENVGSDGQVYFGHAMHLFGWAYSHTNGLHHRIVEELGRLAAETGATAQLCALRGHKYVVLDSREGPGPFHISSDIGAGVPIPWTASGRLLVGGMSDAEIRAFIPRRIIACRMAGSCRSKHFLPMSRSREIRGFVRLRASRTDLPDA